MFKIKLLFTIITISLIVTTNAQRLLANMGSMTNSNNTQPKYQYLKPGIIPRLEHSKTSSDKNLPPQKELSTKTPDINLPPHKELPTHVSVKNPPSHKELPTHRPDKKLPRVKEMPVEETPVADDDEKPKRTSLCEEPVTVYAANRFSNSTVRLYVDDQYWDLMGLPDREGFLRSGNPIDAKYMSPVRPNTTIVTILEGPKKDVTYKFSKQLFWTWDQDGKLLTGGKGGEFWQDLPKKGFTTMFHNSNKTHPMLIAFGDDKVFYISTKEEDLDYIGNPDGHKGGKYKENFPTGIQAAFTWSPIDSDTVSVYLFKGDKYCLRGLKPLKSKKDCDEWRENKELFGCVRIKERIGGTHTNVSAVDNSTSSVGGGSAADGVIGGAIGAADTIPDINRPEGTQQTNADNSGNNEHETPVPKPPEPVDDPTPVTVNTKTSNAFQTINNLNSLFTTILLTILFVL